MFEVANIDRAKRPPTYAIIVTIWSKRIQLAHINNMDTTVSTRSWMDI